MTNVKITVSRHAVDRAISHFRIDRKVAEEWIRDNLRKAVYVSNIVSKDGKPSRLFAYNRIAFVLADGAANFVMTLYPYHEAISDISDKVISLVERELRKAERMERSVERRVTVAKSKLAVERARCEYNMTITPSQSVMAANTKRITEIDEEITKLDRELSDAKRTKSAVAKSLVAYLQ